MKKQLIEKITRELLAEARRYVAKVLTAEPDVRTTAKANGADLAFKIEFKVRPGFSQLPTDDDILDEVGNAIKNTPQVGINSKYSNGNYYYILSPDQSDKKRMFLYNVYIFRKNKVWENYPDWIDRTQNTQSTNDASVSTDNVVVGKKDKPKNLSAVTFKSSIGSMYRIGQSILLNSESWNSSKKNNIKTYKPTLAVSFIDKAVNVAVDMPKLDEPEVATTTSAPVNAPQDNISIPDSTTDTTNVDIKTKTADAVAVAAGAPANPTVKQTPIDLKKPVATDNVSTQSASRPIGRTVTLDTDVPTFVFKNDKFEAIPGKKLNPAGYPAESVKILKFDKTNNYALIQLPNVVSKLPAGTTGVKFKNPGKPLYIYTDDQLSQTKKPIPATKNTYIHVSSTPANGLTKLKSINSNSVMWVLTSELKIDRPNVWIRKQDIK